MSSIFEKRDTLKPYEYPDLIQYSDAVRHSYWLHTEFNYTSDINDFQQNVTDPEREVLKRAMLAIAQIEVAVKSFWGNLYNHIPKPEIGAVGYTFAESEVRHMDAYAHLLEILGLNDEFAKLNDVPVIQRRIAYLNKVMVKSRTDDQRNYSHAIMLFSLFIEHVSLFSQFLIIMSFNKHKNMFKGMSNAVEATSKEEQIHGMFGIDLINIIRKEKPEWFDDEYKQIVKEMSMEAYEAEVKIIDWIFEQGELSFINKEEVIEFIKQRFNKSLRAIGHNNIFIVDDKILEKTDWFDTEVISTKHTDFFYKRSINYNKRSQSVTATDLF
jgi:ribonucleoside-diphosphate reductase beta chain